MVTDFDTAAGPTLTFSNIFTLNNSLMSSTLADKVTAGLSVLNSQNTNATKKALITNNTNIYFLGIQPISQLITDIQNALSNTGAISTNIATINTRVNGVKNNLDIFDTLTKATILLSTGAANLISFMSSNDFRIYEAASTPSAFWNLRPINLLQFSFISDLITLNNQPGYNIAPDLTVTNNIQTTAIQKTTSCLFPLLLPAIISQNGAGLISAAASQTGVLTTVNTQISDNTSSLKDTYDSIAKQQKTDQTGASDYAVIGTNVLALLLGLLILLGMLFACIGCSCLGKCCLNLAWMFSLIILLLS